MERGKRPLRHLPTPQQCLLQNVTCKRKHLLPSFPLFHLNLNLTSSFFSFTWLLCYFRMLLFGNMAILRSAAGCSGLKQYMLNRPPRSLQMITASVPTAASSVIDFKELCESSSKLLGKCQIQDSSILQIIHLFVNFVIHILYYVSCRTLKVQV